MKLGAAVAITLLALMVLSFFVRSGDAMILVFGLMVLNFVAIVWAAVDALTRPDLSGTQRLIWIAIAIFLTPVVAVGAIAYHALGRERTASLFRDVHLGSAPPSPPAEPPNPPTRPPSGP